MNSTTRYLIDSNVFVQAKNFHYRFEFCQAFWQWLSDAHQAGLVCSIAKVRQELNDGNDDDPVRLWANDLPESFFIPDTGDSQVMKAYGQVMQWNVTNNHYRQQAKDEFARFDKADAFLIAAAKAHGFAIVTHEIGNPDSKKRVMIPDAANQFSIQSLVIYDLLSGYARNNFDLNP
ncbi:MAG: DUF4411 family protein [Methylobacter sp.]